MKVYEGKSLAYISVTRCVSNHYEKDEGKIYCQCYFIVELEGVEPSSKQGNHTFSTCLSWPSLSGCDKTQATNHSLIL